MKRKPKKTTVRKQLDAAWSARVRAAGMCEYCGREGYLHAHHIVGRANYRLRFEVKNGVALCPAHHRWAHNYPLAFTDWVRSHRRDDCDYVESIQNEISHYSLEDYQALLAQFKEAA